MTLRTAPSGLILAQLNTAPVSDFEREMAPLFEGAPAFLRRLADARPFHSAEDLFERATLIAQALPAADQVELVNAHPRIGAAAGSMSAASVAEQGSNAASSALQADLDRLNTAYEARFGFRFVIFVAGRSRSEIVPIMESRLRGQREAEMQTALADVVAIAFDRWRKAR